MRYTTFGRRTGLRVSEYALGTGNFGTRWGAGAEPDEARQIFDGFAEAGGTFLDTADSYQFGESEELVGKFVAADRDHFVLATKFTNGAAPQPGISRTGNSRKNMVASLEASLRRLGTDYVDLYWVHFPDDLTPMEEILRGLDDLVTSGKILHVALSNFPAWRVSRAVTLADLKNWAPVTGIQVEYSLVERTADRELLPMAESLGLGAALWSPLGGGLLTGKYRRSAEGRLTDLKAVIHTESTEQKTAVVDAVLAVAEETGATPAQVSVSWLRERAAQASVSYVPIIGPRNPAQLDEYLAALDVRLTPKQFAHLSEVSAIPLGVPHEAAAGARDAVQGGDARRVTPPATPVA
ncbi:aldo/keto reductase [Streptomyces diastatochromogenes]|uniref:Oxidoreductase n=1 Tax=Streptomyces diastatochromogenes TaxID=42236 RepID=A0A233STW4_STRDA|nr:aldo/keto reductase [Streptomyces diastatochromogenes]MCZ0985926.1 aldo/keto reductase [Streptomyces diastatochromogenes]OXY99079.1 oxidoreductase [Streptomyces diastatochromogenes]